VTSELHDLAEPTVWVEPPETFSFSSLHAILDCPRRWQFLNSEWGTVGRFPVRPSSAALEGQIIHDALDRLARALGKQGRPAIGSPAFQAAIMEVGFWQYFESAIARLNENHQQGHGQPAIRAAPRDLANRAIRLFRASYISGDGVATGKSIGGTSAGKTVDWKGLLEQRGSVSEASLRHPKLPFTGIIDLVTKSSGQITVQDYKTGIATESHRQQVLGYAVLWWRETGDLPGSVAVQYLGHRETWPIDEAGLAAAENSLKDRIEEAQTTLGTRPAEAKPSANCSFCPVRARCDKGWRQVDSGSRDFLDVEVTIDSDVHDTGFIGKTGNGVTLSVVFTAAVGKTLPDGLAAGDRLRLISVRRKSGTSIDNEAELLTTSELFRVHRTPKNSAGSVNCRF
jgi:hypothetical protein